MPCQSKRVSVPSWAAPPTLGACGERRAITDIAAAVGKNHIDAGEPPAFQCPIKLRSALGLQHGQCALNCIALLLPSRNALLGDLGLARSGKGKLGYYWTQMGLAYVQYYGLRALNRNDFAV